MSQVSSTSGVLFDVKIPKVLRVKGPRVPLSDPIVIAVTGGRDYADLDLVYRKLSHYHKELRFTHLIHGGAAGLDCIADAWCDTVKGVQSIMCRAHWRRDNKAAGPIRNTMMAILRPSVLIAFPGGNGTEHMKKTCRAYGIRVITIGAKSKRKMKQAI